MGTLGSLNMSILFRRNTSLYVFVPRSCCQKQRKCMVSTMIWKMYPRSSWHVMVIYVGNLDSTHICAYLRESRYVCYLPTSQTQSPHPRPSRSPHPAQSARHRTTAPRRASNRTQLNPPHTSHTIKRHSRLHPITQSETESETGPPSHCP